MCSSDLTGIVGTEATINTTVLPNSPVITPPAGTLLDISVPTIIPQDITTQTGGDSTFDPFTLAPGGLTSINDLNIGGILTTFPDIDDPNITTCF